MFWFKVGLFTLMNIDSLVVLVCPQPSLPMMLKLSSVMVWPVCCKCPWIGEGCLRCSFLLSPRVLAVSPLFIAIQVFALVTVYNSTFVVLGVLVLVLHKYLFDGGVTLKVNLYTILTTYLFNTFHNSFCVGYDYLSYCGLVSTSGCNRIVIFSVVLCLAAVLVPSLCSCALIVVVVVVAWIN